MKVFSIFSGIGGFDLAFQRLNHTIVGACEIDVHARRIYAKHFPDTRIWEDATTIDPKDIPEFDILVGGFPCQAFSIAGKRRGFEDTRGSLFFEIARIAKERRPQYLLLENVKGLLNHDEGRTFRVILATLQELGYDVEWQVLNSKYFVPQNRERVFIVGHLGGFSGRKIFPLGEISKVTDGSQQETPGCGTRLQGQHSASLQTTPNKGTSTYIDEKPSAAVTATYYKGWSGDRQLIGEPELKQIQESERDTYRLYDPDGIARSLRANSGGYGSKTGLYAIPVLTPDRPVKRQNGRRFKTEGEPAFTLTAQDKHGISDGTRIRRLTPLECERLQGFPDNWTEGISDTQRYKCCGNAVTVPVVEYIVKHLQE